MFRRALLQPLVALVLAFAGIAALPGAASAAPLVVTGTVSAPPGQLLSLYVSVWDQAETSQAAEAIGNAATGEYSVDLEPGTYNFHFSVESSYHDTAADQYAFGSIQFSKKNVVVDADHTTVDMAPPMPTVVIDVSLTDAEGIDVPATRSLRCRQSPDPESVQRDAQSSHSSLEGSSNNLLLGFPTDNSANDGSLCDLVVEPTESPYETMSLRQDDLVLTSDPRQQIDLVIPETVTVSGRVQTPSDEPNIYGQIRATAHDNTFHNTATTDTDGYYAIEVATGDYDFALLGGSSDHNMIEWSDVTVPAGGMTLGSNLGYLPYTVHVVDAAGEPAPGHLELRCSRPFKGLRTSQVHSRSQGTGELKLYGISGPDWTCRIEDWTVYPHPTWGPDFGTNGGEVTYLSTTGEVIDGNPETSSDDDGVSDVIEGLGPNGGDGNGDGVPDNEQPHVTSLPGNGAGPSQGAPYVTLVGPASSKLVSVSTSDVVDAATAPPSGTTLPAGLTSFTLADITPGSTQTVSVYGGPMAGVNGYAKYDAGIWSVLPAERVQVFADHVDILLTDGGPGDDDGIANGQITDPGGIAVMSVAAGDITPPVVTGEATTEPNSAGWYRGNVRIEWTASDPGSGVATQPPDTIVDTEGPDVTATSQVVCDQAPTPNCGSGTLAGLKVDKTAPQLAVTGVASGTRYTLGEVPDPDCAASDALSGLVRPCRGLQSGGNSLGVGTFTYVTAAADQAGNRRAAAAYWRVVYRFDGFDQPVNDPASPMSIFKAGSTVPVSFSLKNASGEKVTPLSRPTWTDPVRGSRTGASVNEPVSRARGTSGSAFVLRNGRWTFDWSTRGLASGYVYRIGVQLDDGTTKHVNVGLR